MEQAFNKLSPAEVERLSILAEECAEVIQAVTKILRHGWYCTYDSGITNKEQLEIEIADVIVANEMLIDFKDVNFDSIINNHSLKLKRIDKYLHHNKYGE